MDFSQALKLLKSGSRVCRGGWNGKAMWLALVNADDYKIDMLAMKYNIVAKAFPQLLPWIGIKTADNCFVPWLASQTDILAHDWMVVND